MKWVFWILVEAFHLVIWMKKLLMLLRSLNLIQWVIKLLQNLEDTSVAMLFTYWQESWEKEWKTEKPVIIWTNHFIIVLIVILWMESALRTAQINSIQRLIQIIPNLVEFIKLKIQHYLEWLVMVWILLQKILVHQLIWKFLIGSVSLEWELILMDAEATLMEWKVLKKF